MANQQEIVQAVMQLLSQLDAPQDSYDESGMTSGGEVPIWSQLDAGQLGQGAGAIHDKSALQQAPGMRAPLVGNYITQTDQYGMPMAGEAEMGMVSMGMV